MSGKTTGSKKTPEKNQRELKFIIKRSGEIEPYDRIKIANAVFKAAKSVGGTDYGRAEAIALEVEKELLKNHWQEEFPHIEEIQNAVEKVLINGRHVKTAKAFIIYRVMHAKFREERSHKKGSGAVPVHVEIDEKEFIDYLQQKHPKLARMFLHDSKVKKIIDMDLYRSYLRTFTALKKAKDLKEIEFGGEGDYLGGNELAKNIYEQKYFLKEVQGLPIEKTPEDTFIRISSFVAASEETAEDQDFWARTFYNDLYQGYFLPGGRVLAGAGDLYRLKTLANCFATEIATDSIEDIYKTAYNCARTYSYGGGIGVDISSLRPKDSVVHNASTKSTGAVSFMELYSLTTGLIGQSGRRGALMITLDVKHPDIMDFILCKRHSNWITKQIKSQAQWSGLFDEQQLKEIEKQVRENTQVRFANISVKISDEFMQAVEEESVYGKNKILVYRQIRDDSNINTFQDFKEVHYSKQMPSKNLENYQLTEVFDNIEDLNTHLVQYAVKVARNDLDNPEKRNVFGDYLIKLANQPHNIAVRYAGDFMLYFNQAQTGEIKRLVKARKVWNLLIESNYMTAEPGLVMWSTLKKYSPSDYVDVPVITTNPCSEVPLEHGGACNLASLNLSRFVSNPYTKQAHVDWGLLEKTTSHAVRFLDNVVGWNEKLNPLSEQRTAAAITRRTGLGVMGIADMLNQLGIGFDSDKGIALIEEVMRFIANVAYQTSGNLAKEKGPFPLFNYEKYSRCPFFKEALTKETQALIKNNGLRNVATLSIAPTGTISNIVLGFRDSENKKNYIGVSSGIEPIFSLYYTRRSESFGNKKFAIFHGTVSAYIDKFNLRDKIDVLDDNEELRKVLPEHFFRTAHFIESKQRIKIQSVCQKYVDHSISSTMNLPESVSPEAISDIYIDAWKNGLKGITVYRDGSRYPILSVQKQLEEFQILKDKKFIISVGGEKKEVNGDTVITVNDRLTTAYHLLKEGFPENIKIFEVTKDSHGNKLKSLKEETSLAESLQKTNEEKTRTGESHGGACRMTFMDGKLIKQCDE